jgi:hypothetical protein
MSQPDLARIRDDYARQSAEWERLKTRLDGLPSHLRIVIPALDERGTATPSLAAGATPAGLRG